MKTSEKRPFAVYMAVSFGLAWLLQIIACMTGHAMLRQGLLIAVMAVPTLGVLAAKRGLGQKTAGIGWKFSLKENIPFFLLAWFLPPVLTALGGALYFLVFPGKFSLEFPYILESLQTAGVSPEALGMPIPVYVLVTALQAIFLAPFINLIPALGEEIGWRGYMTPKLQEALGKTRGLLVAGAIWGLWHAPLIILIGYEYGVGYFGAPVTGVLLFCVFGMAGGALLSLLYERTRCIWAPALAHSAINAAASLPLVFCNDIPTEYFLGPVPCGLISCVPLAVLAAVLLCRGQKKS